MVSRWAAYIVELWACVAKFIQATRLQSLVQIKSVIPTTSCRCAHDLAPRLVRLRTTTRDPQRGVI